MSQVLALAVGSVAGGFARYYLSGFMQRLLGAAFPYGTLAVNVIGCFLIGVFSSLSGRHPWLGQEGRILLIVGFCGAFTTFSAFILETNDLIKSGETFHAFANVALSVVIGFFIFRFGILVGERF